MPTTVRPAVLDELAAVADLTVAVYRGEGFSSEQYEPSLRDTAGRSRDATLLVAVHDSGALLGTVTLATEGGPWAELYEPGAAVVRMLAVSPAARGAGVGKLLTLACLERARADGCTLVRLSSQEDMLAAHRLYERLGFTRTREHDWSPEPGLVLRTYALALVEPADLRPPGRGGAARR